MSFVPNSLNEQLSLFDSFTGLTAREKKFLSRFRARLRAYEKETGIDLIRNII